MYPNGKGDPDKRFIVIFAFKLSGGRDMVGCKTTSQDHDEVDRTMQEFIVRGLVPGQTTKVQPLNIVRAPAALVSQSTYDLLGNIWYLDTVVRNQFIGAMKQVVAIYRKHPERSLLSAEEVVRLGKAWHAAEV